MGKVVFGMAMSLDGFVNDRAGSVGRLYSDLAALRETKALREAIANTGAVVMGRRTYDMAQGDFTGYEFQVPIFVLTHHVPDKAAKGETGPFKFHFAPDGIESAIAKAKAAAGEKIVTLVGGVHTAHQGLKAGLIDELQISIVPILLGGGLRLFDHSGIEGMKLERTRVIESPDGRTDLVFRVVK